MKLLLAIFFMQTYLSISAVNPDICFSDPRVKVHPVECETTDYGLYIPLVNWNPNHALHEVLWVLPHILQNCLTKKTKIFLAESAYRTTQLICSADENYKAKDINPFKWGVCVVIALSKVFQIDIQYSSDVPSILNHLSRVNSSCTQLIQLNINNEKETLDGLDISVHNFAHMSYLTRLCYPGIVCNTVYVPLSDIYKSKSLTVLRETVLKLYELSNKNRSDRVNVLLYDRNDSTRRRWVNAESSFRRLSDDDRVNLKYLRKTPDSFKKQIQLYRWADVVLSPHGAALANTIFMEPGSEVIEILGNGIQSIKTSRFRQQRWTGEMTHHLGLSLSYVPCYLSLNTTLRQIEIENHEDGRLSDGPRITKEKELFDAIEPAIQRQISRIQSAKNLMNTEDQTSKIYWSGYEPSSSVQSFSMKLSIAGVLFILFLMLIHKY